MKSARGQLWRKIRNTDATRAGLTSFKGAMFASSPVGASRSEALREWIHHLSLELIYLQAYLVRPPCLACPRSGQAD